MELLSESRTDDTTALSSCPLSWSLVRYGCSEAGNRMLDGYEDNSLGKEGWEINLNNIKPPQSPKTQAKLLKHQTDTQIEFPQFFVSDNQILFHSAAANSPQCGNIRRIVTLVYFHDHTHVLKGWTKNCVTGVNKKHTHKQALAHTLTGLTHSYLVLLYWVQM